jgi:hypothetical protein
MEPTTPPCCVSTHDTYTNRVHVCVCVVLLLQTFWHSSAHVLGQVLELEYGVDLTIGPSLEEGFYYDCYMGDKVGVGHGMCNQGMPRDGLVGGVGGWVGAGMVTRWQGFLG